MRLRSLLYVPASSERFLARAHERGADAVILDLEDSVPEADKDAARQGLAAAVPAVGRNGARVFVRINSGPRQRDDALVACRAGAFGLMVPKVQSSGALDALAGTLRAEEATIGRAALSFLALVEDPAALLDARAIAANHRVIGLALGSEDLATALGAMPTPDVLRYPKLMLHYATKAEGKLSLGLLQSSADYTDLDALASAAAEAKAHGFDGATCVHPSAVPVLNAGFSATAEERAWAERVLAAAATSPGAFELDGRMVDAPVLARARRILAS
ncbi:MAG: Citrate lyase [Devosia sp.]|uniref:HpcH/HpaI aldolase/citrate lyase family protein n=1 Tax=Devosia sp. TaxID=1871048 RepID=UPI00262AAB29|nr:CoA ester lyase [Devosia sp.]MDB5539751.1 Citrate lyase [Devosia sp.]